MIILKFHFELNFEDVNRTKLTDLMSPQIPQEGILCQVTTNSLSGPVSHVA